MEKKISVKNIFLLLVISVGLIGLGIGSTYAVFTASAEINNPIVLNSSLSYEGEVLETIEVNVPAGETKSVTLNINNTSGGRLNYVIWYLNEGVSLQTGTRSGSPQSTLNNGASTTVVVDIKNNSSEDEVVTLGVSSSNDSIVLGYNMTIVPEERISAAYAIYSETDNSLTFYKNYDIVTIGDTYNKKLVTDIYVGIETDIYEFISSDNGDYPSTPWYEYADSIASVTVAEEIKPLSTAHWFNQLQNCSTLDLEKLDTSMVTDMKYMFYGCNKLTSLDLSDFNTVNVTNMYAMFGDCSNLKTLNLSGFNTANVTNMDKVFRNNSKLTTIYVSDEWTTSAVTTSVDMFNGCTSLKGVANTSFNSSYIDKTYALIDEGTSNPGYLTRVSGIVSVDGINYSSWNEAKSNITSNSEIIIYEDFTVDLNGENLTAKSVIAYGNLIDSTDGTSNIVVSDELWFNGHDNGGYMPLKDGNSYRLFALILDNRGFQTNTSNPNRIKGGFTFRFNKTDAYDLLISSVDAYDFVFYLIFTEDGTSDSASFEVSPVISHLTKARDQLAAGSTVNNALTGTFSIFDSTNTFISYLKLYSAYGFVIKSQEKTYTR